MGLQPTLRPSLLMSILLNLSLSFLSLRGQATSSESSVPPELGSAYPGIVAPVAPNILSSRLISVGNYFTLLCLYPG